MISYIGQPPLLIIPFYLLYFVSTQIHVKKFFSIFYFCTYLKKTGMEDIGRLQKSHLYQSLMSGRIIFATRLLNWSNTRQSTPFGKGPPANQIYFLSDGHYYIDGSKFVYPFFKRLHPIRTRIASPYLVGHGWEIRTLLEDFCRTWETPIPLPASKL